MNKYDVLLNNDTVKVITADRFYVTDPSRVLYFYRGETTVACFDGWIGFTLHEASEVPYCNPIGRA